MMCYCNSMMCSCGIRTATGLSSYYSPPYNPMEDAYRIALRCLEDSFEREIHVLNRYYPMEYDSRSQYYHLESEARYRYEQAKNRLYDDFRNAAQRYAYDYANRGYGYGLQQKWQYPILGSPSYQYTYQYINSKETTPVATESKTYIIVSSDGANETPKIHKTYAEAEKEAQRLARKFPSQEFTVFTSTKKYKIAEKPVDVVVCI